MIGPKSTITISRYTDSSDGIGGMTRNFTGLRTLTGIFRPIKGEERLLGGKISVVCTHKFYIDTPIGLTITEKDKLIYNAREFDIVFVNDSGFYQELFLIERT